MRKRERERNAFLDMISSWDVSLRKNRGIQREREEEGNGMCGNSWKREREQVKLCITDSQVSTFASWNKLLCVGENGGKMAMGNDSKRSWIKKIVENKSVYTSQVVEKGPLFYFKGCFYKMER